MKFTFVLALALSWLALTTPTAKGFDISTARVSKHSAVFTHPPQNVPTRGMPDGPLLGNGDLGVTMAGAPHDQQFYIGKNDFWRRNPADASIMGVGLIHLSFPALAGASYHQEQALASAEVRGTFTKDGVTLHTRSWVDAHENLLVTILRLEGTQKITLALSPKRVISPTNNVAPLPVNGLSLYESGSEESRALFWFKRKADSLPGRSREVAVVTRVLGTTVRANKSPGLDLTLQPGQSIALASCVLSDLDAPDFLATAQARLAELHFDQLDSLSKRHQRWWADFWGKSFIEIPDQEIEKRWYAALYIMGSCSREGKVAPGLWGNWVTTDQPNWHGDFHLNYNFQAPYYGAYSANHAELSHPYYQAIQESIPNGRAMAQRRGWKGVHFPVCIGPWGLSPEDPDGDWGQRSNAAFAALNFIWYYQYTMDLGFLSAVAYPYLSEVAAFWEDYLKLDNGRYVILNDSIHEGSGKDMNPILSLGLVRTLFKNLITMSSELGVDAERRSKWQDISARLSDFPVQQLEGKTVFRYSEQGTAWWNDNTLGIQHIFPAGAIGLESAPDLLQVTRNTITAMNRWHDNNGFSSWYTACARVGYQPTAILTHLRKECDTRSYPNLILHYGGGGIENVAGFLAINEMMLQSHEGFLRIFPVWPKEQNARFSTLRGRGAFLVSGTLADGKITNVTIRSEKGLRCAVQNPWPGSKVQLIRNGITLVAETQSGERFTFPTKPGETIELRPL
jgi:alpha-L-fucosidase 2